MNDCSHEKCIRDGCASCCYCNVELPGFLARHYDAQDVFRRGVQASLEKFCVDTAEAYIAAVRQEAERPTGAAAQPAVDPGSTPGGLHE